jgi:hypothetical protein
MFFFKKRKKPVLQPVNDPHDPQDALVENWEESNPPTSWQQVYWGMMYQSTMKDLPKPMQEALFAWWDTLIPKELEGDP